MIETWKNDFGAFVNSLNLSRDDYKTMMEYIDEIHAVQPDHVADVSKKVFISCAHENNDVIFRKMAIEAIEKAKMAQTPDGEIFVAKYNAEMNIQLLPSAQPEPHWIPCSERLPDKGNVVLWCNEYGSVFASEITFKNEDYWCIGNRHRSELIAWMPLPEPYR